MKILVPTDFSDNANRALRFAISIINRMGGSISLYHVYRVGSTAAQTFQSKLGEIVLQDKLKALKEIVESHQQFLRKGSIESEAAYGDTIDLIVDHAKRHNYNLICMGVAGETESSILRLGNITLGVVRRASTPILTIPQEAEPVPIDSIVLAVDSKGLSSHTILENLIAFAKLRGTVIKVYHHATPEEPSEINPETAKALEGVEYTYHNVVPDTDDISDSIQQFVDKEKADLLCLVRRQRGFFSRLFSEHVTRDSIFDSEIPILLVKD